ncbi:V/A-type H+-transporting ATPase subunit I [Marinitoga hydrogenitolerans DSM 16785]|uniref:V/A-type H+-transporting ATPase subunit I n=1 Tax=Marinitoga hydrogenitolerans (strain DSM 16785 / JCM 12826 / AT1271) TaxID=1122195 RepID=A0A1M4VAF2_MARH1|nr:V-type ATPase 116kDa subunit family protein [Marinitoga hydrogenitolerans]SHE65955.1 V/A-type H+-transporting ATPase subunit I [Marinitoga hydrogenitolerans DSM 16785]
MHEKLKPFTIISNKYELESISKKILDSQEIEIISLDKVLDQHALKVLKTEKENAYKYIYENFINIFNYAEKVPEPKTKKIKFPLIIDKEKILEFSKKLDSKMKSISETMEKLKEEREKLEKEIEIFEKLKPIKLKIEDLKKLKFLKYTVGKISTMYYARFLESIKDRNILVINLAEDSDFTWLFIIYDSKIKIEKTLSIANFQEYIISNEYIGTPKEILWELYDKYRSLKYEIEMLKISLKKIFFENRRHIYKYFDYIFVLKNIYDLTHSMRFTENFFVISGWATEKIYSELLNYSKENEFVLLLDYSFNEKSPTLLRNNSFFKHFEFVVKMFGTPSSDEIDPTPIISILFLLFYGMMFGDAGQGMILSLFGFWIYKKKKNDLFYIIGASGISSVLFGILYGSFFGFENVIKPLWKRPMDNINYFLMLSIYFGIAILTAAMSLNIINKIKNKKNKELIFDPNGYAGISLYWILLGSIFYMIKNGVFPSISYFFIIFLITLIYIKSIIFEEGSLGEKIVQGFFELFEVMLGYLSNTLSFIRLGAFALNHAGLFLAFYMMSKMTNNSFLSFTILLLGNVLIIVLEGLVVFIQTLRLEYYEFFTRFFKGNGKEFNPIKYKF